MAFGKAGNRESHLQKENGFRVEFKYLNFRYNKYTFSHRSYSRGIPPYFREESIQKKLWVLGNSCTKPFQELKWLRDTGLDLG